MSAIAAHQGILDRDDAQIGLALLHSLDRLVEGRAGNVLRVRQRLARGEVGIGPGLALEGDAPSLGDGRSAHDDVFLPNSVRAFSRSAGVSTLSGTLSDARHRDAHARFQRAKLFELLAHFERGLWQRDEARERGARVGVDADVVIERGRRPTAPGPRVK